MTDLTKLKDQIIEYKALKSEKKKITEKMDKLKDKIQKDIPNNETVKIGYHSVFSGVYKTRSASIKMVEKYCTPELAAQIISTNYKKRFEVK